MRPVRDPFEMLFVAATREARERGAALVLERERERLAIRRCAEALAAQGDLRGLLGGGRSPAELDVAFAFAAGRVQVREAERAAASCALRALEAAYARAERRRGALARRRERLRIAARRERDAYEEREREDAAAAAFGS